MTRAAPTRPAPPATPLLYDCITTHRRRTTIDRTFRYTTSYWLIDVDRVPELPGFLAPLARFRSADHLGDPANTLAGNIRNYLREHEVEADQVLSTLR